MNKILKIYLIGAVVVFPGLFLWALSNMWGDSLLQYMLMGVYAMLLIPVLAITFYLKSKETNEIAPQKSSWLRTMSYVATIIFIFVIIYIILIFRVG